MSISWFESLTREFVVVVGLEVSDRWSLPSVAAAANGATTSSLWAHGVEESFGETAVFFGFSSSIMIRSV